jgi:hypothetical protein
MVLLPIRKSGLLFILCMAVAYSLVSLSAYSAENRVRFSMVLNDAVSFHGDDESTAPSLSPGEHFQTLISIRNLKVRQGRGSVMWVYRYYVDGYLSHNFNTESYSGFQEGSEWDFYHQRSFTVDPLAGSGLHRIEIEVKDNNSGTVFRESIEFMVINRPFTSEDHSSLEGVSVKLTSVMVQNNVLVCTFIVTSHGGERWLNFRDGFFIDKSGRRHEAIVGGTVRGDGSGGLNLSADVPMRGEVHFDSFAALVERIETLIIHFGEEKSGQWKDIPVPYRN